jgi:D-threonate/D-erythronate kinase
MHRFVIIADDLSGSADCGIAFSKSGLSTIVVLGARAGAVNADVLSVDGDTRRLDPERAADKTERLMREFAVSLDQIVFKKLDSTLRGNIGSELAAVLKIRRNTVHRAVVILAPAFPAHGRTTVGGRQFLHGKRLEQSEISQREGTDGSSFIPEILCNSGLRSAVLSLELVRSGNGSLRNAMMKLAKDVEVLVCDAETDDDLRSIAVASATLGKGTVWAGSAGLAYHLPQAIGLVGTRHPIFNEAIASGPTLFVIGSPSNASREQARVLAASAAIIPITIPTDDLITGSAKEKHKQQLAAALSAGRDVVVSLSARKIGASDSQRICAALAEAVAPHADSVGALVATGGETAHAILQSWNVSTLRLVQEVETGVPFCIIEDWRRRLPVITKAGGFGSPQSFVNCRNFLTELDRAPAKRNQL